MAASSDYTLNVPFNLTSKLVPIFLLPSRFLARIRLFDELFNQDIARNNAISTANDWGATAILAPPSSSPPLPSTLTPFPGPWGFLTSGYALVLFTMVSGQHSLTRPFITNILRSRLSSCIEYKISLFLHNVHLHTIWLDITDSNTPCFA
jgi:hypothetical protein